MNDRAPLETRAGQRVLVTGGAGFLGSYVCERLVTEGATVTCVDSLLTGRKLNVADLKASGRFEFVKGDVSLGLPQLQVDEIWNLACAASPPTYQTDPVHTMMTNVLGMNHCLALAHKTGARLRGRSRPVGVRLPALRHLAARRPLLGREHPADQI